MHNLFAGLMGLLMGFGNFFHTGVAATPHTQAANQQTSVTPEASSSGRMKGMRLTKGERPFFGTVTAVNGSTLTVQMQMPMMRFRRNPSITPMPSVAPSMNKTITITLDSSTNYTGGSQTDITTNTRIAGVGKVNSDGSITAVRIIINPTMPTGMPMRGFFRGQGRGYFQGSNDETNGTTNNL